jgi:HSP20 family protein
MAIVRWDPFSINRWPTVWDDEEAYLAPVVDSNLDIYETENEVVARANIAGIPEDKVEITFDKGILWIRGEEESTEKEGKKYYRKATRSYSYKIAVPGNIDLKQEPEAEVKNGVLSVTFKKAEEAKPKKIAIKAGK